MKRILSISIFVLMAIRTKAQTVIEICDPLQPKNKSQALLLKEQPQILLFL